MDLDKCRNILLDAIKSGKESKVEELANEIGKPVSEVKTAIDNLNAVIDLKARQMHLSRRAFIRSLKTNKVRCNKL